MAKYVLFGNFKLLHTGRFLSALQKMQRIMPAVTRMKTTSFIKIQNFRDYVKQFGTIIESYYPFGGRDILRIL